MDFAFRPRTAEPLSTAEALELADLLKRFPNDPNDPLNDAIEAWGASLAAGQS
jgi:hypothetical protein